MKHLIYSLFIAALFMACNTSPETTDSVNTGESEELARLRSELRDMESKLVEKDSVLNESIMLFNEIEENLAKINLKEDEIRFRSNDIELAEDGKQWILQEIESINYLREENQKKVGELNKQLANKNVEIAELKTLVSNLMNKIEVQEEEIEMLRVELADLDTEYVELLEAYQEQSQIAAETIQELNTVYYAYGSEKELIENGVIVKEGRFLMRTAQLRGDLNDEYFTQVDLSKKDKIEIVGKKVKFITDHPSSSYEVISEGQNHTIQINDPKTFWKVSKYLVVVVD
ncbi:MAG: chromosome segregation ATPase [Crocinitomix sp.]|jgi:chromosome segregation ATPase